MKDNPLIRKAVEDARKEGRILVDQGVAAPVADRPPVQLLLGEARVALLAVAAKAARSERDFQDAVTALAQGFGWKWIHFRAARVNRGGKEIYETPFSGDGKGEFDLQLLRDTILKVELKFGKNKPTAEQMDRLADYKRAGVEAYIWWPHDWDEIVTRLGRPV